MNELILKIKKIAADNEAGFTIRIPNCEFVKSGYVVAMLETQNSFGEEGLLKVVEKANETTHIMGGWNEEGLFYWDAVYVIPDRETAIRIGKENQQIAIFHIETAELIYL